LSEDLLKTIKKAKEKLKKSIDKAFTYLEEQLNELEPLNIETHFEEQLKEFEPLNVKTQKLVETVKGVEREVKDFKKSIRLKSNLAKKK